MTPELAAAQGKAGPGEQITVRHCHGLAEFEVCVELQREVWGGDELEIVPLPLFVVAEETGGEVLGAFAGARMVGFTMALAGTRQGVVFLHSHMTAVRDGYRDRGIGRRLKLLQRDDALSRGIELVEWTFDPLEIKNAYFNFMRLGAIARRVLPNCYGITTSPLHGRLPTDRLMAEWWLRSPRVEKLLAASQEPSTAKGEQARILVPAGLAELKRTSLGRAASVQREICEQFQRWFDRGYAATGMEISSEGGSYLLQRWPLKE